MLQCVAACCRVLRDTCQILVCGVGEKRGLTARVSESTCVEHVDFFSCEPKEKKGPDGYGSDENLMNEYSDVHNGVSIF